jgi:hypothetical protein
MIERVLRAPATGRGPATILMLAIGCALITNPQRARADVATGCDFLEISAQTGPKPAIDAALAPVEKKLKKPPLSAWNQFKLLSSSHKALAKKKPEPVSLKMGGATATLIEIVDKGKVRLNITMDDDKGKQVANNTATVEPGDYVIFVHELSSGAGHLLSLTCR